MITIRKFSKPNCRPCTVLANYLTEINFAEHSAKLVNVDIADQPEAIDQYGLTSVPVLVFERSGVEVTRIIGLRPVEEIVSAIEHAKVVR
jgi:thioredoxin 1